MSNISTFYDTILTRTAAVLPAAYQKLSNPYQIDQNQEMALRAGYGIAVGPAENTNRQIDCNLSIKRTITVTLTRKHFATELNRTDKEAAEKQLLEDQLLLVKEFEKDPMSVYSNNVTKFVFVGDNGIESVFDQKNDFLKLTMSFDSEYFEAY
jgi:hypothetical protein